MPAPLAIADDPIFAAHLAPAEHPERPERLDAAREALSVAVLSAERSALPPRDASLDELGRVHSDEWLETLGRAQGKTGTFDADTYFAPGSVAAARRAAGAAIAVTDALLDGRASSAVALVRPPGHHARRGAAMGFCLLNNVAVAAAHARARGASRVMIVDWDVHHGNGTEEIFYGDEAVLYVSLHQAPFYPGTGAETDTGAGNGIGFTLNVPLSEGAGDEVYEAAFERLVAPVTAQYDPDLLLISAGFDAHARDPLAGMRLSDECYGRLAAKLARALPRGPAGRIGLVLEGGYDLAGLRGSLARTLEAIDAVITGTDDEPESPAGTGRLVPAREMGPLHTREIERACNAQTSFWRLA